MHDDAESFIGSEAWVDLLPVFRNQLITGHGNDLKETAPIAVFEWSVDDANGDDSMVFYDLTTGAEEADCERTRAWLLSYNEGDVRATATCVSGWQGRRTISPPHASLRDARRSQ